MIVFRYKFVKSFVLRYTSFMIKDTQITGFFGVPRSTIQDMKKTDKDNWRFKVYTFLKQQNEETIKKFFEDLKSD